LAVRTAPVAGDSLRYISESKKRKGGLEAIEPEKIDSGINTIFIEKRTPKDLGQGLNYPGMDPLARKKQGIPKSRRGEFQAGRYSPLLPSAAKWMALPCLLRHAASFPQKKRGGREQSKPKER